MHERLLVGGVDEVNFSPSLAGDCVVAAAVLLDSPPNGLLKDSKKTTKRQRLRAFEWLQHNSIYVVEFAHVNHLQLMSIYHARNRAFERAMRGLIDLVPEVEEFIIDGKELPIQAERPLRFEIDADDRFPVVSAASIIAKVYCDALFFGWGKFWPGYEVESNHGTLSKVHRTKLRNDGPSPIHRRIGDYGEDWWRNILET